MEMNNAKANIKTFVSASDAMKMAGEIVNSDRLLPIVALTCRRGEKDPAMDSDIVAASVGDAAVIWILKGDSVTRELEFCLGSKSHLVEPKSPFDGAARIWWPADDETGEVAHELVFDQRREYGERQQHQIRQAFCPTRDNPVPAAKALRADLAELKASNKELEASKAKLACELRATKQKLAQARKSLGAQRKRLRNETCRDRSRSGLKEPFRKEVATFWARDIARNGRSLEHFEIDAGFESSMQDCEVVSRQVVIRKVAMLVGGMRDQLNGHPFRLREGGTADQVVLEDGSKVFRAYLQESTPGAARLHYALSPGGNIRLLSVRAHDDVRL